MSVAVGLEGFSSPSPTLLKVRATPTQSISAVCRVTECALTTRPQEPKRPRGAPEAQEEMPGADARCYKSMSALPIIVKQNSPSVGLFTH